MSGDGHASLQINRSGDTTICSNNDSGATSRWLSGSKSVVQRMDAVKDYRPVNLPARYRTFPMPQPPEPAATAGR